jgi:Flp pilus assembly protein CpaB
MKPKTMILLVVAVTCGLGASYMTSKLLAERKGPPPEEKVRVLVAKARVTKYTVLKEPEKFFEQREMPKAIAPKSFFSDLAEIKDKRVNKEFKADVHISPEDVADRLSGLPIPDGFGSVGLKVTAASSVSFFVTPGDKVDVIWTQRGDNPSSRTMLRDVLVLSVGEKTTKPGEQDSSVMQAQTVNLAVTAKDAAKIALAEEHGQLRLRLLKEGDPRETDSSSISLSDLKIDSGSDSKPHLSPVAQKEPQKKPDPKEEEKPAGPAWTLEIKEGNRDSRRVSFWADGRSFEPAPAPKDGDKKKDKKDDPQAEQDPDTK